MLNIRIFHNFIKLQAQIMTSNIDIINAAVALIVKAAILASRFSGRARKRSLERLASMDINDKDKEIVFLRDKVYQQQMQITILQKGTIPYHICKFIIFSKSNHLQIYLFSTVLRPLDYYKGPQKKHS